MLYLAICVLLAVVAAAGYKEAVINVLADLYELWIEVRRKTAYWAVVKLGFTGGEFSVQGCGKYRTARISHACTPLDYRILWLLYAYTSAPTKSDLEELMAFAGTRDRNLWFHLVLRHEDMIDFAEIKFVGGPRDPRAGIC